MSDEKGKKLLTAVERILASSERIRATVEAARRKVKATPALGNPDTLRELTARALVRGYSNRAAIAGGASGLPGLFPGLGALALSIGGGMAELTLLLKWEVEMALALSHLYGFDIDDPRERQLGFLMASVGTYDATGKNFFADVMKVEGTALWNYAPRKVSRMIVTAMAVMAALYLWRGLLKAVPVLGIAVGSAMNKGLTRRVGERIARDLRTRRDLLGAPSQVRTKKPKARTGVMARRPVRARRPAAADAPR